jgi:hypothetical protein
MMNIFVLSVSRLKLNSLGNHTTAIATNHSQPDTTEDQISPDLEDLTSGNLYIVENFI